MRRCGFVAVVGRPNVGKSTLINALAGGKVSIVSRRRQTTRGVIRAVCERESAQIVLLDTPGRQSTGGGDFNRRMNLGGERAMDNSDAVLFMIAPNWHSEDELLLPLLPPDKAVVAAVNKIDLVGDKKQLLPLAATIAARYPFAAIVPISARRRRGLETLTDELAARLPPSERLFDGDGGMDGGRRDFFCAELLREKLFRGLRDELPYCLGVVAESKKECGKILAVKAEVLVERESQKAVVIGRGGLRLKKTAQAARKDMEVLCGEAIFLTVRVRACRWRQDEALLRRMQVGEGG